MTFVFGIGFVLLGLTILGNRLYLLRHRPDTAASVLPRLSVMIPARNEEANVSRVLRSVLAQDHPEFEVLIYDDGSEDRTLEEIQAFTSNPRLTVYYGEGPPAGWVGKVHALYRLTREARGEVYIFLDADVELTSPSALRAIATHFGTLPAPSVLTALPRLRGGGMLLVSLIPHIILMMLPWFLVRRIPLAQLGALNGQCWMIDAETYHRLEPHETLRAAVLEDVEIGRLMKSKGVTPVMADVRGLIDVYMYDDLGEAWRGLTKNAYLITGGSVPSVIGFLVMFVLYVVVAPLVNLWFAPIIIFLKGVTDRIGGFPIWISLLTPVSYLLAAAVLIASATGHLTGRVAWKGRNVAAT
jgi:glycosyltransferase involved in cell wall biosynthesis